MLPRKRKGEGKRGDSSQTPAYSVQRPDSRPKDHVRSFNVNVGSRSEPRPHFVRWQLYYKIFTSMLGVRRKNFSLPSDKKHDISGEGSTRRRSKRAALSGRDLRLMGAGRGACGTEASIGRQAPLPQTITSRLTNLRPQLTAPFISPWWICAVAAQTFLLVSAPCRARRRRRGDDDMQFRLPVQSPPLERLHFSCVHPPAFGRYRPHLACSLHLPPSPASRMVAQCLHTHVPHLLFLGAPHTIVPRGAYLVPGLPVYFSILISRAHSFLPRLCTRPL